MDPFDLSRFVSAQEKAYPRALEELKRGRKASHWMWFVFPQFLGLGKTSTSVHYAIKSWDEAVAYLDHPLLGNRLRECTDAVISHKDLTARQIFGTPDDLKFRSSMTLFSIASEGESRFIVALERFYAGVPDSKTIGLLGSRSDASTP